MECDDEDLAPSQKEAERKAETEYHTAVQQWESAKSALSAQTTSKSHAAVRGTVAAHLTKSSSRRGRPPRSAPAATPAAAPVSTTPARSGAPVSVVRGRGRPRGSKFGSYRKPVDDGPRMEELMSASIPIIPQGQSVAGSL